MPDPVVDPPLHATSANASTAGREGVPDTSPVDVGRRTFFRRVAEELVHTAASVTGAATVAQGAIAGTSAAVRELGTGSRRSHETSITPGISTGHLAIERLRAGTAPWTWDGGELVLLDQRRLPGLVADFRVTSAAAASRAIGERVVTGPSAAAVAAWGLALTADAAEGRPAPAREALLTGAERSLAAADAGSFVLRRTIAMVRSSVRTGAPARASADAVAAGFAADHERLAAGLARLLEALGCATPLLHGPSGSLWGAGSGTALEAVAIASGAGLPVRPWVTEGRPWHDGARTILWELARRHIEATLVLDAAAPGAVASGRLDVVLCAAEHVAGDGSASLPVGALGLALAAAHRGTPFVVCAAPWSMDPDGAADGDALAEPPIPASAIRRSAGVMVAPADVAADGTWLEVVPASLITHLVTVS